MIKKSMFIAQELYCMSSFIMKLHSNQTIKNKQWTESFKIQSISNNKSDTYPHMPGISLFKCLQKIVQEE